MRMLLLIVGTLVVGTGLGAALAVMRMERSSAEGVPEAAVRGELGSPVQVPQAARGPRPRVKVDREEFNFGAMDSNSTGRHTFVLTNVGQKSLHLSKGDTSCKCTLSELDREDVPPGESAKVTLEWTAKTAMGEYRQTASIKTNDSDRPMIALSVIGNITRALRTSPREVVFTQVSAGDSATAETCLYAYLPEPLKIEDMKWEDPKAAEHFSVETKPLSEGDLEREENAKSGCRVRVTVKPGLPLGTFKQTILARTNYPSVPELKIPVVGVVNSDIAVVGRDWDAERRVLKLGSLGSRKGAKRTLLLVARGPHRDKIRFKPIEVQPDWLQVRLGKTKKINAGTVTQTPLTIEIPQGSRPANYLGPKQEKLGRVILETQHPKAPELRIFVQFAVESD